MPKNASDTSEHNLTVDKTGLTSLRKRWTLLLPVVFVTYSLAYLDRANFGFGAAAGLATTLHLSNLQVSLLAGLFFLGYFGCQVPGANLIGELQQTFSPEEGVRRLAARSTREDLVPHSDLPQDTRLWAARVQASGGVWGGCVYDTDQIVSQLANGEAFDRSKVEVKP